MGQPYVPELCQESAPDLCQTIRRRGGERRMKYIQIAGMIVPLLIVAVGMASWIFSLRADIDVVIDEVADVSIDTALVNSSSSEGDQALADRLDELEAMINDIEKTQAIITNEYRTIMADHGAFAETLQKLDAAGSLPAGERRIYGGYGQ